jgi:hypothetical protein
VYVTGEQSLELRKSGNVQPPVYQSIIVVLKSGNVGVGENILGWIAAYYLLFLNMRLVEFS